ncbi:MAG: serine--tRNA ligase, partial [Muribaculaceae bacterium]|nr:serine--tRNA ligase [Muribaculaceae bacterium]
MLTLQQIKEDPQLVIERLAVKGFDGKEAIASVLAADERRRALQLNNDNLAAQLKQLAASIGALMKQGEKDKAEEAKASVAALKEQQKAVADELAATEAAIRETLLS